MPEKHDLLAAILAAKEQGIGAILAFAMAYLRGRYNGGAFTKTVIDATMCAINHYRDNAIAYKEQRDKATSTIADMQKRQRDVAELDARYTKELADANATISTRECRVCFRA